MPDVGDLALAAAISQVLEGESFRSVAEQYHVSRNTLKRRIDGFNPRDLDHSYHRSLSRTLDAGRLARATGGCRPRPVYAL